MALIQGVQNGQIIEDVTTSKTEKKGNDMGYDQFLQILCAEMQYQDPLNPTSNTEYVAQMATFTQVESMLNMQNTMAASEANALVGKYCIMKVTSSTTGQVSYASGNVDYVLHQNGKTFLSINDALYNIEDLDTVADTAYMEAIVLASEFKDAVSKLPSKNQITLADKDAILALEKGYNSLTEYQKSFIDKDTLKSFNEKLERYKELEKTEGGGAEKPENGGESTEKPENGGESTEKPENGGEGTEKPDGTTGV